MSHSERTLRIFVVEDDADTRQALALFVRHLGHEVTCAAGIDEAVEALARDPQDVVLADIGLGDGSGWDLIERLRSRNVACPEWMIAMSGFGTSEDRQRSLAAGYSMHLVKPLAPAFLRNLLAEVASGEARRTLNEGET